MSETCYSVNEGGTWNASIADWAPCGTVNATNPRVTCCQRNDACMTNDLCYRSNSRVGASGFYSAGCTNSDFGPGCSNRCADTNIPEAVYNGSNTWKCCGKDLETGFPTCQTPTDQTFFAPDPNSLIRFNYAGQTLLPLSVTTSSSSTSTTPASSSQAIQSDPASQADASSSSPSGGAIAGIAIGALLAVIALCAFIWFLLRRRRERQRGNITVGDDAPGTLASSKEPMAYIDAKAELDSQRGPYAELDHGGARSPVELSAGSPIIGQR